MVHCLRIGQVLHYHYGVLRSYLHILAFSIEAVTVFNGKVEFIDNKATNNGGNAIFASTLQNCVEDSKDNLTTVILNWKNFDFSKNPETDQN